MKKDVHNSNGDSPYLELIPSTSMPRKVGDKDQVYPSDDIDAPREVGFEDKGDENFHYLATTPAVSHVPLIISDRLG